MSDHPIEENRPSTSNIIGSALAPGSSVTANNIAGRDINIHNQILPPLRQLPLDYSGPIGNFWHEYLGTDEHPVPFGGRADMLSQLHAWWQDEQAPAYGLLTAEAGRGKSALLVRWAKQMMEQQRAAVLFVPISIRFQTNSFMAVFSILAAYLAQLHGEEFSQFSLNSSPEPYQQYCFRLLKKPLADGRPLLIILDGLDEAMGWQAGPHLFPVQLPPQTKLLVSARLTAEFDEAGWRDRLGWSGHGRIFRLPFLSQAGVADVLQQMGNPLDAIANQLDVVATLYRLSEGDPLLVRLYVELLSQQINQTGQTSELVAWLQNARPGLDGYFDRWQKDQRTLWGKDSPLKEETTQRFMNLLAAALGPLSPVDLDALDPTLSRWDIEEILLALARFIIYDRQEQSFTFSHPKLGFYFYDKLSPAKQRDLQQRFLNYGATSLQQMQTETETDYRQYRYVIRHYVAHLQRANAPYDDFTAVLCHAWARAWHTLEGTYAGFLADVEQIRKKATDRNCSDL